MTIASMTGFAREAGTTGPYQWAWEVKAVNGRGLDVRVRAPAGFDAPADEARQALAKALSRGQCQLGLTITRAASAPRIRVNREALGSLIEALSAIDLPATVQPASLDGLLSVRGIVEIEEADDPDLLAALHADLRAAAGRLTESLVAARQREGQALQAVLEEQIGEIERLVAAADAHPGRQAPAVRERLAAQIEALMGASSGLDPARLHQEAVLIASRADIREELDRLRAHVEQARGLLGEGGAIGRRLDFLAQEFGREANTLCAKANDVSLSRIGLDLKAVVEQFREQVQNVE